MEAGDPTLPSISPPVEEASLLLNRDNRIFGNDYKDVSGYFRVTPQHEKAGQPCVATAGSRDSSRPNSCRTRFQALPNAAAIQTPEFSINTGQQEETIRELATKFVLDPGQVAVIGCRPEYKRGLGNFLLTQAVAHSDQRIEKLILIWASRNLQGQGPKDRESSSSDRPVACSKWLMGPAPTPNAKPVAPNPRNSG